MQHYFTKSITLIGFITLLFLSEIQFISAQNYNSFEEYKNYVPDATIDFKITTLNSEWLSCSTYDPSDDNLQITNIAKVIAAINPDVIALQEVGTSSAFATIDTLVKKLGTSTWAGKIIPTSSYDNCGQNQGIIYKKSKIQLVNSSSITNGGTYSNWSSGRYPILYTLSFIVGTSSIQVSMINIHAKAMSDETSYNKRKGASEGLKTLLDGTTFNTKNVIIIGDFNDYLIGTQCATMSDSPFKNFVDDAVNYKGITSGLYDPSYSSPVIDNMIISNEMFASYVTNSTIRETTATSTVSNYKTTTSDHVPVSAIFRFTIPTGVENWYDDANILLYPNPTQDYLSIKSDLIMDEIFIYNLTGVEMLSSNATNNKIDVSQLPQGIYIVKLKTSKGIYLRKMLKN